MRSDNTTKDRPLRRAELRLSSPYRPVQKNPEDLVPRKSSYYTDWESIRRLLDFTTVHDSCESIRKLMHHHLSHICTRRTRYVSVTNAVFGDEDIVA